MNQVVVLRYEIGTNPLANLKDTTFPDQLMAGLLIVGRYARSTAHVPSDTLRTGSGPPPPKGTCSFEHLKDLEVVPPQKKKSFPSFDKY